MSRALTPPWRASANLAFVLANARYWTTVAPLAHKQLSRWQRGAEAIPDRRLMALATAKLREERFNAEVAATLATLTPRACRARVVEAIVALQVLYDYLDAIGERAMATTTPEQAAQMDRIDDGQHPYQALIDAVALGEEPTIIASEATHGDRRLCIASRSGDGGYPRELADTVTLALAKLPASDAIAEVAQRSARRCADAQMLGHASAHAGTEHVEQWARREAAPTALGWREWLAGAQASVLSLHALIAAAAHEHTTGEQAVALDSAYLSIGALTMLDSVIDRDLAGEAPAYTSLYDGPEQMGGRLSMVAREAAREAGRLPDGAHHVMTLAGVVAYYASAPAARQARARPVFDQVRAELGAPIAPVLLLMRGWRLAKTVRAATAHAGWEGR
ncbi:MAG TPA: DUF2600 family protein [Solirubrobacteraceae bacterium]|jgi:hypothetical protein|nr:DUF2600 family protein [Solirubrobacteraceae bacterium]